MNYQKYFFLINWQNLSFSMDHKGMTKPMINIYQIVIDLTDVKDKKMLGFVSSPGKIYTRCMSYFQENVYDFVFLSPEDSWVIF